MHICLNCFNECNVIPIEASFEDEPLKLDYVSDCCYGDIEEIMEEEIEEMKYFLEHNDPEDIGLTEREEIIKEYLSNNEV